MKQPQPDQIELAINSGQSLTIAKDLALHLMERAEHELLLKRLEHVRVPYASCHSIENGMFSINNGLIAKDAKEDD